MIIDNCVHPLSADNDELRRYMQEPWNKSGFPGPERYFYPTPTGEYTSDIDGEKSHHIASDPKKLSKVIFADGKVNKAILVPFTRGLLPDLDLSMAICRATNDWLADRWLDQADGGEFLGSIRIDPRAPAQAISEIERWASDPRMVQIAVPLQSHRPYGNRDYLPVWEAAAAHSLPVLVQSDGGSSVDYWPSAVGYYSRFLEYATLFPLNFGYHLISLIAEGVFERFENFKVIFADGGGDLVAPLIWRLDKDWRPAHSDTPWNTRLPSEYLTSHVRFISNRFEGPENIEDLSKWVDISSFPSLTLFGSKFPTWLYESPGDTSRLLNEENRQAILQRNAKSFYALP